MSTQTEEQKKSNIKKEDIKKINNIYDLLNIEVRYISGVGPEKQKLLNKLEIYTLYDLITYFPKAFQDRSKVTKIDDTLDGEYHLIERIVTKPVVTFGSKRKVCKLIIEDETGEAECMWFNQPYLKNIFKVGYKYKLYGKVKRDKKKIILNTPVFDESKMSKNTGYIVPIYKLTYKLSQNEIRKIIQNGLKLVKGKLVEHIPQDIIEKYKLMEINQAYQNMHFPPDVKTFKLAKRRLIYDELFITQVALSSIKSTNKQENIKEFQINPECRTDEFVEKLPFQLTNAQKRVIAEIEKDMESKFAMNRLVQGDVGSGKTVVAMSALYKAVKSNCQGVMMAPTAILATQHYNNFKKMLADFGITCELLISNIPKKQKMQIIEDTKAGKIDILIGTHALLEDNVQFKNLGLVITDEQHRFGVRQREKLNKKAKVVDTIVMSATPIPRTLGLILYGDLDVSVIDEYPPNRKIIKTYAIRNEEENRCFEFIEKNLQEGRQAYIVCPLIEDSDEIEVESVTKTYEKVQKTRLNNYNICVLHGKLKEKEKNQIMEDFKNKKIDILISTTVIEVGVDVPNANIMVIRDSQRFGLAQLHQLRGRVGRGEYASFCILLYDGNSQKIHDRMEIMTKTNDGFKISEKDLEMRGMGDFFGTAQHGLPEFKVANLFEDLVILQYAQKDATELVENNLLNSNERLKEKINSFFSGKINI